MKIFFAALLTILVASATLNRAIAADDPNFRAKLSQSLEKTEQSVKLLRQQITQSQNAPFLPDLYVQLGDLLSQKALTLYYVQMERDSKLESGGKAKVEDSKPVVDATKEAIQIYNLVINEFPKYPKKSEVSYKLALSLKSIEETAKFIAVSSRIQEEFPGTEEAMRAGLLLGRHFLDAREYDDAMKYLKPISESKYNYEKNLAKYWIGLVYIGREKYKDALDTFEVVILDKDLKEQENPYDIKGGTGKSGKTDLKREALIDSIRAYTFVFEKNPNPVDYYSRLAPTEVHFQEVMEKLAVRYVMLKKYNQSVRVLRTMSERTADPQRVINVYREVLLLIPMEQRLAIPVEEFRFIVQKFTQWRAYFSVPQKVLSDAYWFFEKQVRDIGTRNHDMAKVEKNPMKKRAQLEIARDYYSLYEAYFDRSPNSVKMGSNLADVYYLLGNYFESGETYLKLYQGFYGKVSNQRALIENAILSLQKDKNDAFYPKVRSKGVLLKAITSYQALVPAKKRDDELEFLRLKTQYDQGFMPEAIDDLYAFVKPRKNTKKGLDAANLILDYYNTLNDFTSLEYWADRILSLKMADADFNAKVRKIKQQAKTRSVEEKVKAVAGYDEFSQGKSYLAAAMQSGDESLKDAVLQEALAKSKAENDIQTFFQAAFLMAKKEPNVQKRVTILRSIAQENMKVGRFYHGIDQLKATAGEAGIDQKAAGGLWEDAVNTAVILHDRSRIRDLSNDPRFARISSASKNRIREQIADALDSPMELGQGEAELLFRIGLSEESLLGLFKARARISPNIVARVDQEARSHCGKSSKLPICRWLVFQQMESNRAKILQLLRTAPADLQNLEPVAGKFMDVTRSYQQLEGGADSHLETAISIRGREIYLAFAAYLGRVAAANPTLKAEIGAKAQESQASAKVYQQKCQTLYQKAIAANPAMKFCSQTAAVPSFDDLLSWTKLSQSNATTNDPDSEEVINLRKSIFSAKNDAEPSVKLAALYYQIGADHHAVAMSTYGMGQYPAREADYKAIMGCSLVRLGYLTEANFHLRAANDYLNLKSKCLNTIKGARLR